MAQEIELKFIVDPAALEALRDKLNALPGEHSDSRPLHNIYYETEDNQLRRHNMGLRIRGDGGRFEMTMKIAGRAIGGLHQRPEYNVAISKPGPELALLPAEVWPEGLDVAALQAKLRPLFSTHFSREKWVVTHGISRIELALDLGEVNAGERHAPICELELELLEGETADLLALAESLVSEPGLRQSNQSKAARGYQLAQGHAACAVKPLGVLYPPAKATVEQGLEGALELALGHWLYHEELWLNGVKTAKQQIVEAVGLLRHAFVLFGGIIPRKASTHLREQLLSLEARLAGEETAGAVVYSAQASRAKLALIRWLVERQWRLFIDEQSRVKLGSAFKRFADIHLSRHAAILKETFQRPLGDSYADRLPRLARETDAIRLLAGVYGDTQTQPWLENWQRLRHAIVTRQRIEIEHYRNEAISQPPFWLHSGKY